VTERAQNLAQIDRLVSSHTLHGSESLCKLLRYLALHALDHPGTHPQEYQIATEVFGRQPDFDPQVDSTIRVQAGRLRVKLAEFYSSEGAEDPVIVELPKGAYVLTFHHRASGNSRHDAGSTAEREHGEALPTPASRTTGIAVFVLSALLVIAIVAIVGLSRSRKPTDATAPGKAAPAPVAFQIFWQPFLTWPEEPTVVFSNAAFIGRPETGMRYYDAKRDPRDLIWDHYTGVGEVLSVHGLDQVFAMLHREIRVKRGSLFSLDDAKNNDLIFVGSPSENLTLMEIPNTKEFIFQRLDAGPRKGDLALINVHPQAGEPRAFLASPSSSPLTEDYAVIGLTQGLSQARAVLILAGTTTFGTQGAVEYVCRQNSVEELLKRLGAAKPGDLKPFEALIRIKIARGVPVATELVAVRKNSP
jgi:hypothetical protein